MISLTLPNRKTALGMLALFALVSLLFAVSAFQAAAVKGTFDNTDQANIGIMALRLSDPTVYARDYVFQDTHLFEFYTPVYLGLVRGLTQRLGTYDRALAAITPMVLLVYLVGIFLFLYQITQNSLVSAWIGLISASQKVTIAATFWGVAGISTMMPRTLFLMVMPWLLLLWFLWLEEREWWKMPANISADVVAGGWAEAGKYRAVGAFGRSRHDGCVADIEQFCEQQFASGNRGGGDGRALCHLLRHLARTV
jgi:hypothetical protein